MAKISVIPFMLLALLVAVQAQDFFPSEFPSEDSSPFSESDDFPVDGSDETNSLPLRSQQFALQTQSQNSFPSEINLSFDFQGANSPFMTNDDPLSSSSSSSDSEFLGEQDSQDDPNSLLPDFPRLPPLGPHDPLSPPPLPSETPSTPPPTPSESPLPPSSSPSLTTCKAKCAAKCDKKKVALLKSLCSKVCKKRCILLYSQAVYKCTEKCAEAMPSSFKSDEKKVVGYVRYCFHKCTKKF